MSDEQGVHDRHISAVLETARADATRALPDHDEQAEKRAQAAERAAARQIRPVTEWTTTCAALIAAHTMAVRAGEDDATWADLLAPADSLHLTDPDERTYAAMQIRRSSSTLSPQRQHEARLVAAWLAARDERLSYATAGHLARHVFARADRGQELREVLRIAWWGAFGPTLVGTVRDEVPGGQPGRPSLDQSAGRAILVEAARQLTATGRWRKTTLAQMLGVSRSTLDAWLR